MTEPALKQENPAERIAFKIQLQGKKEFSGRLYSYQGDIGAGVSLAMCEYVELRRQEWMRVSSENKQLKVANDAAAKGSFLHTIPQAQAEGKEIEKPEFETISEEEVKQWTAQWEKTSTEHKITAEHSELTVYSKIFHFGGTIDRVGMFDGKRMVMDFKTGRFHYSDLWKTEAYRQAYMEMTGDRDVGTVVIYLPRPELVARGEKPRHFTIQQHTSCFSAFLGCYHAFKMNHFKELQAAGMSKEAVFQNPVFALYERENGVGPMKGHP